MRVSQSDSTLRRSAIALACWLTTGIATAVEAAPGAAVILNVPSGSSVLGEGVEAPYLHGVPTAGSRMRPQDIRAPAPFGTQTEKIGNDAIAPGPSGPRPEPLPVGSSEGRDDPVPSGAPSSARSIER
jgi:hypothetical protein